MMRFFGTPCIKIRLVMSRIAYRQVPHFMGHQLEPSFIASWTVLIQLINFAFYSIKIPLVTAEIAYSQLPHFMGHQLEASFIASWTVLIKQTNFAFYSIKIRPVIAEIAYSQLPHFMGHQLDVSFIARVLTKPRSSVDLQLNSDTLFLVLQFAICQA